MNSLRVVFMGTPEFSVPVLQGLIDNYNVVGVVTQPDKEVGRDQEITMSPIKKLALKYNIPVVQPAKVRIEYQDVLDLKPDIIITCAYGQIIPKEILDYPKYKCVNVHASLLPKLRGGAPIHRAILEGYDKTGITIMFMDEGMDTGDIITTSVIPIDIKDTVGIIHDKLSILGKEMLLQTLPDIIIGNITPVKQNTEEATIARNIKREDELVDFDNSAIKVYNKIRGLNPFPVAYTILDGKIIKLYASRLTNIDTSKKTPGEIVNIYSDGIGVATSDYEIVLEEIKPEGKKKMFVKDYLNGIVRNSLLGKKFSKE